MSQPAGDYRELPHINVNAPPSFVPDETGDVDVGERGHQVLTVEAVHDSSVAGDGAGKVLGRRRNELS